MIDKIIKENFTTKLIYTGLFILFILPVFFFWQESLSCKLPISSEKFGQFGDFIGGVVGTLWSLASVILFYIALTEQRKDFKTNQEALEMQLNAFEQQIKEFELQREELIETRKIFEQQTKTMKSQQFESNFYSLLNVFVSIQENFLSKNLFTNIINEIKIKVPKTDYSSCYKVINSEYLNSYLANRADLAKYFMTLYRLFKIIEESPNLNDSEKIYYHKILRSQINKDELLVLYYNYHSGFGKNPVPIALKYEYFKHLELFSKFEFEITFNLDINEIIHFNKILPRISELVNKNIEKAKQISDEEVKEEIEIFKDVYAGIYIEDDIDIRLVVKNNSSKIDNIDPDKYKEVFKYIIIDIIFSRSFRIFKDLYLKESTTTSDSQVEFNFKFNSSNE